MITQDNFTTLLQHLDFKQSGSVFSHFPGGYMMQVDFSEQKLIYPDGLKIEGEFTTNFSSNENFVVFECVHRLLLIGYKPHHLTLEPKWKVGHGASGGRADIQIKDNEGKVFAIIECKTAGKEFDNAWEYMQLHPSQLFSYAQQERSTQALCLYASDWEGKHLDRQYYALSLKDNEQLAKEIKLTYKQADTVVDLYNAWKETYGGEAETTGLFEDNSAPFLFGRIKYSVADLKDIAHADIQKKYHRFATILRKHNVSGRENAFDKLVNLFLCKVVDEKENPTELKFYWKGLANDTHFDLQDRLQSLYQKGMDRFLKEHVTYISQNDIDEAFRFLDKGDPDATKRTIDEYFKKLKFFTNNDFAFIEVHNEDLFKKNAAVLLEIVEMLQGIRLVSEDEENTNQFLGDMFEGFLDAGVKQSEGQFFTPMPIVKFIVSSLPLAHIIAESEAPPKAIDYACGAGHFLTELAQKIKQPLATYKTGANIRDYFAAITGIEKEYRLSKVAKVSAFMYGQDDIQIVHADALTPQEKVTENSYQILVANPPYSVKGFLETLRPIERRRYELYGSIDEKGMGRNNAIETFFIERAVQLLAPGGVAGIILPSSILSNDSRQYQQAREILLRNFQIVAIAELGSGTFGKTGTNTVTLFLRRRSGKPSEAEHFRIRTEDWIHGDVAPQSKKNRQYQDLYLLEAYCQYTGIAFAAYKDFLVHELPNEGLKSTELWQEYEKAFYNQTEIKNLLKRPAFNRKEEAERQKELAEMLARFVRRIEADKLFYFLLAYHNGGEVLIIRSPADNKAMKKFLGYEWSSAKGNEGIKYLNSPTPALSGGKGDTADDVPQVVTAQLAAIQTPLYHPANDEDESKLNYCIRQNFLGAPFTLPESLKDVARTARLMDMLDFSRKDFGKAISLTVKQKGTTSKYPLLKLGEVAEIKNGATPDSNNPAYWEGGNICWASLVDTKKKYLANTERKITQAGLDNCSASLLPINTVIFSSRATIGEVTINKVPTATNQGFKNFVCDASKINYEYLYYLLVYLKEDIEELISAGTKYKEINTEQIWNYKIPVPPKDVQQQIVAECRRIDETITAASEEIYEAKELIDRKVEATFSKGYDERPVSQLAKVNPSKSELKDNDDNMLVSFIEMASVNNDGFIARKEDRALSAVRKGSYTYFADNDIIIAKITPCMENGKCALAKDLTNGIALGSSEFHVFRANDTVLPAYLFYQLNRQKIRDTAENNMTGSSGHRRVPDSFYKNLRIPVPPLPQQQALVSEIEMEEARIAAAQRIIAEAPAEKAAVLKKFLE